MDTCRDIVDVNQIQENGELTQMRVADSQESKPQNPENSIVSNPIDKNQENNLEGQEDKLENQGNLVAARQDNQETLQEKKENFNATSEDLSQSKNEPQALSKRQQKKLLKRQRWIDTREERKKREREKQKLRMEAKRAAGEACGNLRKRLKEVTMASSTCKQRIAVDMSFDELMIERHLVQCVKQLSRCYSANRRSTDPMQFYVTSFEGKCKDLMARQNGYMNWDVNFRTEKYTDMFPKDELVYLTSESDNVITTLDDTKVYVIGGLVDHNVHKGLCYKLALEQGIKHAKLPLDDCIEMKTRKVLTVDQVFKILLGITQGKTWKQSCLEAIPPRKGAVGKDDDDDDLEGQEQESSDLSDKREQKTESVVVSS